MARRYASFCGSKLFTSAGVAWQRQALTPSPLASCWVVNIFTQEVVKIWQLLAEYASDWEGFLNRYTLPRPPKAPKRQPVLTGH